jgi:membrane protein
MTGARSLFALFRELLNNWNRHKDARLGAALAYYAVFSLVPLMLVLIGLAGLVFGREAAEAQLLAALRTWLGSDGANTIGLLIDNARQTGAGGTATVVGMVTLLMGSLGLFGQLQSAFNTIWEAPPPAHGFRRALRDRGALMLMVAGVGALLLVSLVTSPVLTGLGRALSAGVPGSSALPEVLHLSASFAGTAILFAMLYRFLPDAPVGWHDVWPGALLASALFSAGHFLIALYVGMTTVGSAFGAASSLVALLIWIYYSAQIVLFGAEVSHLATLRRVPPASVPGAPGMPRSAVNTHHISEETSMNAQHAEIVRRIRAAGEALTRAVGAVPAVRQAVAPKPGEWSVRQALVHTRDVALFAYGLRARRLIAETEPVFQTYNEDEFRKTHPDSGESAADIASLIAMEHEALARLLSALPDADWQKTGSHPEFGTRTLEFFAQRLAEHGEEHAAQIADIAQSL